MLDAVQVAFEARAERIGFFGAEPVARARGSRRTGSETSGLGVLPGRSIDTAIDRTDDDGRVGDLMPVRRGADLSQSVRT